MPNTFATETIVCFHIGRGGHFNNAGHLSYLGQGKIGDYVEKLFLNAENLYQVSKQIGDRPNLRDILDRADNGDGDAIGRLKGLGLDLGDNIYFDGGGNPVGLTEDECDSGVGRIDIDGGYNTTYCQALADCNEGELQLIFDKENDSYYPDTQLLDYLKEALDIVDESTEI